jgi:hypothetical protein
MTTTNKKPINSRNDTSVHFSCMIPKMEISNELVFIFFAITWIE